MDITSVAGIYGAAGMTGQPVSVNPNGGDFDSILNSAMDMVKETNSLQHNAQQEKISFALGETENTHDLLIAEQKATIALQYTVAVRDRMLDAYKEIMNMQI